MNLFTSVSLLNSLIDIKLPFNLLMNLYVMFMKSTRNTAIEMVKCLYLALQLKKRKESHLEKVQ